MAWLIYLYASFTFPFSYASFALSRNRPARSAVAAETWTAVHSTASNPKSTLFLLCNIFYSNRKYYPGMVLHSGLRYIHIVVKARVEIQLHLFHFRHKERGSQARSHS